MLTYIVRRLVTAVLILFGASFVVYQLTALSGDPLEDLRGSNAPNRDQLIQQRIDLLDLDTPAPLRYFGWLAGAAKCLVPFAATCDLGQSIQGEPVATALVRAMGNTITLVTAATFLAIVIGVSLGIITALRQYSGLDYGVTFMSFLFFSLPIFWLAVLLKEFGAIGFNNFLADPQISGSTILVVAIASGLIWSLFASRPWARKGIAFVLGAVVAAALLFVLGAVDWFSTPGLGPVVLLVTGVGAAFGIVLLTAGLRNRKALLSALIMVALGLVAYYVVNPFLNGATVWLIVGLAIATVLVGLAVGYVMGGYDRGQSMRAAASTGLLMGLLIVVDRFMVTWPSYVDNPRIRGRPIATVGAETPGLDGGFWINGLDTFTHLLLPTLALLLASLAGYSRYSRASMLEIMNMDYIRTARAKGLSERTVIMRHAFRNALIPLATLVAFDIGALIGGAIITEQVFAFAGMGQLFVQALQRVDPDPIMGFFLVAGILALVFNLLADIVYSFLDPRVRVKA
ncbi:ABC transporter permease [Arthrobacter sp. RIT-PI-e]|uniref:ABC transporter permease n=1 Tax=Arthrobacter sp. RIT-PI-e TaxID=1681197 RepID=UPI0006766A3D|nr:ABC transporter permease [Arthrobacter sp. RIT-PI-e]KNC18575.1 ABC transporter permease [Arthrobacter sp. RIT-PI-e]